MKWPHGSDLIMNHKGSQGCQANPPTCPNIEIMAGLSDYITHISGSECLAETGSPVGETLFDFVVVL